MKSNLIIIAVALVGLVVGLFLRPIVDGQIGSSHFKALTGKYAELNFNRCDGLSGDDQSLCADSILFEEAQRVNSLVMCDELSGEAAVDNCKRLINRKASLGGAVDAYCQGVRTTGLCLDLAKVLAASENDDFSECSDISQLGLQDACFSLFGPRILAGAAPINPDQVNPQAQSFGLMCADGDDLCASALSTLKEAATSNQPELCAETGLYRNICNNEVIFYQAFLNQDQDYCEGKLMLASTPGAQEPDESLACVFNLYTSNAIEASDPELCNGIEDEQSVIACKNMASTATEGRFDYLER